MQWVEWAGVSLALVGLWVTVDKTAAALVRVWWWLRRDRVTPLLALEDEPDLCYCCVSGTHCDGSVADCECTCTWPEDWAEQELPPEQSAEDLGFTGPPPPSPEVRYWHALEAKRERRVSAAEAEYRAAYESLGFDYPSGLLARMRELTP